MATIYDDGDWGFKIKLSHIEACTAVIGLGVAAAVAAAKIPQPYGAAVGAQLLLRRNWIKGKVETGGYKPIILKFNWLFILVGIKRTAFGDSPCGGSTGSGRRSGGGEEDTDPQGPRIVIR